MNDKKNPKNQGIGSGYLQSKILNAKERIEYEVRDEMLSYGVEVSILWTSVFHD